MEFILQHWFTIMIMTFLLLLSGFFSSSETALFGLRSHDLKQRAHPRIGKILDQLLQNPHRLLITILFCNMVVNLLFFSISLTLKEPIQSQFGPWGEGMLGVATVLTVILLGEVTPKAMALLFPYHIVFLAALPLKIIQDFCSPIVLFLENLSHIIIDLFPKTTLSVQNIDEIKAIIASERARKILKPHEVEFIAEALDFETIQIKEVMIPRMKTVSIDLEEREFQKVFSIIESSRHSYYPVYQDNIDNIIGILKGKEFLLKGNGQSNLEDFLLPACYLSEYSHLSYGMVYLKRKQSPMAIVVDEYGGFSGIITLEDMVEEVFGEIQDEFDEPLETVQKIRDSLFVIPGSLPLRDLEEMIGIKLDHPKITTVSGWISYSLDRIPKRGDRVDLGSFEMEVIRTKRHRVTRALVRRKES